MGGCKWDPAWANPFPWAQPLPGKPGRAFCSLCGTDFSCDKGVFSVKQHEGGNKHDARAKKAALEQSNKKGGPSKQGTMESAVRKAEAAAVKQRRIKDQARVAEAKIATLIATHVQCMLANNPNATERCPCDFLTAAAKPRNDGGGTTAYVRP